MFCLVTAVLYVTVFCHIHRTAGKTLFMEPHQCTGSDGKCAGTMQFNTGLVNTTFGEAKKTVKNTESRECRRECIQTEWCLLAQFNSQSLTCKLYDHKSWTVNIYGDLIYIWYCCQPEKLCYPVIGRCPGYWESYANTKFVSKNMPPIDTLTSSTQYDCWKACLMNQLCGSINYHMKSQSCELIYKWGYVSPVKEPSYDGWAFHLWQCCRDHIESFPDSKCQRVPSHSTCTGKWIFNNSLVTLPNNGYVAGIFNTQDPHVCLKACQLNLLCIELFYQQNTSTCVLIGQQHLRKKTDQIDTIVPSEMYKTLFQSWKFACCLQNIGDLSQHFSPGNSIHACLRITNENGVKLYKFDCTQNSNILSTITIRKGMAFYNISDESMNINDRILVSNGYRKYWLSISSEDSIEKCADDECEAYSGAIKSETCPEIVKRSEWYAIKPKKTIKLLSKPKYVVILNTVLPSQSCCSIDQCTDLVRRVQYYHAIELNWSDIAYNFLVGDDGRVYEGRGWQLKGAHSRLSYNQISIGIAFIGWFKYKRPSTAALNAAKELIQCGVNENYLDANYKLVAHRDIRPGSLVPGMELYKIMSNWPHYIKTNNNIESSVDCTAFIMEYDHKNHHMKIALPTCLIGVLFICVIGCTVHYLKCRNHHKQFCKNIKSVLQENRSFFVVQLFDVNCTTSIDGIEVKLASNVEMSVLRSQFYLLCDADVNCNCQSLIANLINYSAWMKRRDVCNSLSIDSILSSCTSSTLFLVSSAATLFGQTFIVVLHMKECNRLTELAQQLLAGECVCHSTSLLIKKILVSLEPATNMQQSTVIEETPSYSSNWLKTISDFKKRFERAQYSSQDMFYENFGCPKESSDTDV